MQLDFGDYKIVTDERQFIVQKKKVIQAGKFTKEANVGKEYFEDDAYCTSLNSALKFLCKKTLLDNDDLLVIKEKLAKIESKIDKFTKLLNESEGK